MTPKVFISYSWDSDEHKAWVKNLADRLFSKGVNVILDQYEAKSGDNITYFMERAVTDTDKILLILTENYKLKADGRGGGVGYEYSMINAEWYKSQTDNNKFIPILRGKNADNCKPIFVNSFIYIDMSDDELFDEKFKELYFRVYDEPMLVKPKIGQRPNFEKLRPISKSSQINIKSNRLLIDTIRELIGASKIKQAIDETKELAKGKGDTELLNDVITISEKYQQNERKNRIGTLSFDEYFRNRSKIADSLLGMLQQIGKGTLVNNNVVDKEEIFELIENGDLEQAFKRTIKKTRGTEIYRNFLLPLRADYKQYSDDQLAGKDIRGKLADITQRFSQIIEKL